MNELLWIVLISILPIFELRGSIPLAVNYCLKNDCSIWPVFIVILILNLFVIFIVFFFLDFIHKKMLKFGIYNRAFERILKRTQKKIDQVEKNMGSWGYAALAIFVAIPLPATGAYTGALIAWFLGLDRKKSAIAISVGVIIAGIIVLLGSLGILSLFY
jgi:uncharacterized membrane protein